MAAKAILALVLSTLCNLPHAAEDTAPASANSRISAKLLRDKFDAGEYWSVGSDGLNYLKTDPGNHELRMQVADSLAWTGRYAEAIIQYQMLESTRLSVSAMIGLANVYRWSGRPDIAGPLYRQALKTQSDNPDAIDGLNRVNRELRPGTIYTIGKNSDSLPVIQHSNVLAQHWRGDNLALKYELAISTSRYTLSPVNTRQTEVDFSVEHADMPMAPKLALSVQQGPITKAFGSLRLKLDNEPDLNVTIGHVNWGNMAYQPQALLEGLTATQLGADGNLITRIGTISAVYNAYQISDGNQIQDAILHFSPSWHPLGPDFRYFVGLSWHFALRNVPTYWSPQTGYLSADIGFSNEWSLPSGEYSIYAQRGFGIGGEALNSYNAGFAAKRYIDRDWAAMLSAGLLKNQRIDAYHSKYLSLGAERLW